MISIHASRGGSDHLVRHRRRLPKFQSTLPAGEATSLWFCLPRPSEISIHASRGGSDLRRRSLSWILYNFNPRFPRGKRPVPVMSPAPINLFQSTLPAGEATVFSSISKDMEVFQSTLPAGEATRITTLLLTATAKFQSTLPAGEATYLIWLLSPYCKISIHASRGGSDFVPKSSG